MASSATSLTVISLVALVRLPFYVLRSSYLSSMPCHLLHHSRKLLSPSPSLVKFRPSRCCDPKMNATSQLMLCPQCRSTIAQALAFPRSATRDSTSPALRWRQRIRRPEVLGEPAGNLWLLNLATAARFAPPNACTRRHLAERTRTSGIKLSTN